MVSYIYIEIVRLSDGVPIHRRRWHGAWYGAEMKKCVELHPASDRCSTKYGRVEVYYDKPKRAEKR